MSTDSYTVNLNDIFELLDLVPGPEATEINNTVVANTQPSSVLVATQTTSQPPKPEYSPWNPTPVSPYKPTSNNTAAPSEALPGCSTWNPVVPNQSQPVAPRSTKPQPSVWKFPLPLLPQCRGCWEYVRSDTHLLKACLKRKRDDQQRIFDEQYLTTSAQPNLPLQE